MKRNFAIALIVTAMAGSMSPLNGQARPNTAAIERGYADAMKKDLRTVATAEEAYFVDNMKYYAGTVSADEPLFGFKPSANVTLTVSVMDEGRQWVATATHALTPMKCTFQLEKPTVCVPPPPSDTSLFATPRDGNASPADAGGPRITVIGTPDAVRIRATRSRSWQFDVRPSQPRCTVSGQVVGLSGDDRKVVVLIMTEFAYQDWLKNQPARTYYESEQRSEIPFDVRIEGEGQYRLVVWNPSSGAATKVVQLQHAQVGCTE
jgi:hypothetical protein